MNVELLYFDGCPGYEQFLPRLRALVAAAGGSEVELRRVESPQQAVDEQFLGSPTVRVDGLDVDPDAANRCDFGLKCRLYRTSDGLRGTPPDDWIAHALERARRRDRGDEHIPG